MSDEYGNEEWVAELIQKLKRESDDKNLDDIEHKKNNNVPKILYRYRKADNNNINTLDPRKLDKEVFENQEWLNSKKYPDEQHSKRFTEHAIWLSHPNNFFDVNGNKENNSDNPLKTNVDSVLIFSDESLQEYALNILIRENLENICGKEETRNIILKDMNCKKDIIPVFKETAKKNGVTDIDELMCQITEKSKDKERIDNYRKSITERIFNGLGIACFTTDKHSDYMWENYADSGKGFCLEYDMTKYRETDRQKMEMFPVYYTDKNNNMDILIDFDYNRKSWNCKILPIILTKHISFKNEKEWRLVIGKECCENGSYCPFIKPSKIYLGYAMTRKTKKEIKKIADKMDILVISIEKGNSPNTYYEH